MKKNKKFHHAGRMVSLLLVLCMILGAAPTIAFAAAPENVSFQVERHNGATGSVYYRFDNESESDFKAAPDSSTVPVKTGATSIIIKAEPGPGFKIDQTVSGIYVAGAKSDDFNLSQLQSATGYTYTLGSSEPQFRVEFDTTGGSGGPGPGPITNPTKISVNVTGNEYLDTTDGTGIKIDGYDVKGGSVTVDKGKTTRVISLLPQITNDIGVKIGGKSVSGTPDTREGMEGWINYTVSHEDTYNIVIEKTGSSVYTVVWDYVGDFGADALVSNGTVRIISATLPDGSNGIGIINDQTSEGGHVAIKPGSIVTVEIKPDYGYQFVKGSLNGVEIKAEEDVSTFTFVMDKNNLHMSALFTEAEDIINTDSKQVQAGSIAGGANVVDSGNLKLEIGDLSQSEIDAVDEKMKQTAGNDEVQLYLNMDLYSVVNKGTRDAAWEKQLTDLNGDLSVTLELSDELKNTDGTFYVIREHEETDGSKTYTKIQATYDKAAGTITFTTNKFSTYALVLDREAQQNNSGGGSNNIKDAVPKTGDASNAYIWFILAFVSGIGALYFGKKGLVLKKGN